MSITLTNSGSPMRPTRSSPATGVADRAWVKLPDPVLRCRDALRVASPCLRRPLLARCVTKKGQLKSGRNAQTGYMFLVQGHKALSGRVATWHPGTACPSGDPTNVSAEKIRASPCSPARQGAEQGPCCCVKAETEMRSAPRLAAPRGRRPPAASGTGEGARRARAHGRNIAQCRILRSVCVLSLSQARRPGPRKDTSGVGPVLTASPSVPPLLPACVHVNKVQRLLLWRTAIYGIRTLYAYRL